MTKDELAGRSNTTADDGARESPNDILARAVVDELVTSGLVRATDRSGMLEALQRGTADASVWRMMFGNQLEAREDIDESR